MDSAGRLTLARLDVATLARTYGTPLYVYDEATIRTQCRAFRAAFAARWPETAIAYAGKAYLSLASLQLLLDEGLDLDAVSAGELGIALAAGFPAKRIHLHGNYKPLGELATALEVGVGRIVVDSLDELDQIEALARERRQQAALWLRLNPNVPTRTHVYTQTGHAASKFGLGADAATEAARRIVASDWLDLAGLHAHAGSQLFELAPFRAVVAFLCDFAGRLRETVGVTIRELSPGGGLGVAYTPDQTALSVEDYAQAVTAELAEQVARLRLAPLRLIVEPGRAIVARAGVALYMAGPRKVAPKVTPERVTRERNIPGSVTLAVDGGMGDNPRPALYGARYFAALPERMLASADERVRIVGRYCESGDVLVEDVALPQAQTGDILAIPVSGAYHLPMASNYNGVPRRRSSLCAREPTAARRDWRAAARRSMIGCAWNCRSCRDEICLAREWPAQAMAGEMSGRQDQRGMGRINGIKRNRCGSRR